MLLRILCYVSTLLFAAVTQARDDVELAVKPALCIVDQRTTSCDMRLALDWRAGAAGDFCLHREAPSDAGPLQCWAQETRGQHEERKTVSTNLEYFMRDQADGEKCATALVEVLQMESTDRRRNRRSRHVWDLL